MCTRVDSFRGPCYAKIQKKLIMKNRLEKRVILNHEIASKGNFTGEEKNHFICRHRWSITHSRRRC